MNKQNVFRLLVSIFLMMIIGCSQKVDESSTTETAITPTFDDLTLSSIISTNGLLALSDPGNESNDLIVLGETLFADQNLSGPRNISCLSCHSISHGTGDGLPFSIGTGATGEGPARRQIASESTPTSRNSPALYNLGRTGQQSAFWDGRVSLIDRTITSSVPEISGTNPSRVDIKNVFTNVYDIQPLFPLLSSVEMLGTGNDLALHTGDINVWQAILSDRLLIDSKYINLFGKAYPTVNLTLLNPGHIGRAIGAFMKIRFKANNTPFDKYVSGDLTALTAAQKRGMITFYGKGQCVRCHGGSNFTDLNFHSVGAPQIGFSPFVDDLGRESATGLTADRYKFKTPSLRNVGLTAPYMHNGSMDTLEAVVNHYNDIPTSLSTYSLPTIYQSFYQSQLIFDNNSTRNQSRINQIDVGALRTGLRMTTQERTELVDFLKNALRDPSFN